MTTPPRIIPILETLAATIEVMPWGVSAIHSCGCVLLWDSRDDADAAIMAAIASDNGGLIVDEATITLPDGRSILGTVLTIDDDLEDFAADIRTAYLCATGPDPGTLENPF